MTRTLSHDVLFKAQGCPHKGHHAFSQLVYPKVSISGNCFGYYVISRRSSTHTVKSRGPLRKTILSAVDIVVEDKGRRWIGGQSRSSRGQIEHLPFIASSTSPLASRQHMDIHNPFWSSRRSRTIADQVGQHPGSTYSLSIQPASPMTASRHWRPSCRTTMTLLSAS